MQEMQVARIQSLGGEDLLEEGMATHSSILAWRIPWTEEPGSLQSWGRKELDTTEATEHARMPRVIIKDSNKSSCYQVRQFGMPVIPGPLMESSRHQIVHCPAEKGQARHSTLTLGHQEPCPPCAALSLAASHTASPWRWLSGCHIQVGRDLLRDKMLSCLAPWMTEGNLSERNPRPPSSPSRFLGPPGMIPEERIPQISQIHPSLRAMGLPWWSNG